MPTVTSFFENSLLHDARRFQHELLDSPDVEGAMLTRRRSEILQASDVLHELFLQQRHQNTHTANFERACRTEELGPSRARTPSR